MVRVGTCFFAPFIESEQLGSHDKPTVPASKPVSPMSINSIAVHQCTGARPLPVPGYLFLGDIALAASRAASRSAMAWRLS
jgi:hypothetical protein